MEFKPVRTLLGTKLITPSGKKFELSQAAQLMDFWKPVIKHSKIGFESVGTKRASIACEYDGFEVIDSKTIVTKRDKKYGLILKERVVHQPKFDTFDCVGDTAIISFYNSISKNYMFGIIDIETGDYVKHAYLKTIFPIDNYNNDKKIKNFELIGFDDKIQIITQEGKTVVPENAKLFKERYFMGNTYYTYIDENNNTILVDCAGKKQMSATRSIDINENYIIAKNNAGTRIYEPTKTGSLACTLETNLDISYLFKDKDGNPVFKEFDPKSQLSRLVDKSLKVKTKYFGDINTFDADYLQVIDPNTNLMGLIGKDDFVQKLACQFDMILPMHGRPTFAQKNNLWGVLGTNFETLVDYKIDKKSLNVKNQVLEGTDTETNEDVCLQINKSRIYITHNPYDANLKVQKVDVPSNETLQEQ